MSFGEAHCGRQLNHRTIHMSTVIPPPLPGTPAPLRKRNKVLIGLGVVVVVITVGIGILLSLDLIRPFSVPTGAMEPAISPADHIMMEGLTYVARQPRRGDIAVFRTEGITGLPSTIYVKRIAGEPGDQLRIDDGKLYINDKQVVLSNAAGAIDYVWPAETIHRPDYIDVTVPAGHYYVLGDNSTHSMDSRSWGFVPAGNIMGRVAFCFWPPARSGEVK